MSEPLLAVDALRVTYGAVVAVDDMTFDLPAGTVTGLIGPNGAGKTTLVDALTGFVRCARGRVTFGERDITGRPAHVRARLGLGRTFQSVELFDDLSVLENLLVAAQPPGTLAALGSVLGFSGGRDEAEGARWALEVCGLQDVAHDRPRELSHGQRKLVGVARALARRPTLLLLDEPAAGLDTDESRELGRHLAAMPAHGVSVLLIDHDMSLVLSVCERVLVVDFGRLIADGTPQQIRDDPRVVEAYLGGSKEKTHART